MKIGDLAKRAGINIQSIRFYEREQLLDQPVRTPSGYRSYNENDLEHVTFIKQCQHLGFTLKEIKELADLHRSVMMIRTREGIGPSKLGRTMAIAQERLHTIEEKICAATDARAAAGRHTSSCARPVSCS